MNGYQISDISDQEPGESAGFLAGAPWSAVACRRFSAVCCRAKPFSCAAFCGRVLSPFPRSFLTYSPREPQTRFMPHTYIQFDFAKDEDKVQQARHKLEGWKQAYRLDKKLLFKFERIAAAAPAEDSAKPGKTGKPDKSKGKSKDQPEPAAAAPPESVKLLVRLDFSNHEKLSGQRWLDRIPSEEPFQSASPTIVKPDDVLFADTEKLFDDLV